VNGDWEEPSASYIPERYRLQIAAKKRRQLLIRVAAVIGVVAVCAAAFVLLAGSGPAPATITPGQSSAVATPIITTPVPATTSTTPVPAGTGSPVPPTPAGSTSGPILSPDLLAAQKEAGIIPNDQAQGYLRDDFPPSSFSLVSADVMTMPGGTRVYAFVIRPVTGTAGADLTVYIDAVTGDPFTPDQDRATVSLATAKNSIADAFPGLHPDRIRVRYSPAGGQQLWNFSLFSSNTTILTGSLDAETGQMVSFTRIVPLTGRQANPAIDNGTAEKTANRYIGDRNGPVSINLSAQAYAPLGTVSSPAAGSWIFDYRRLVQDYPCDSDGFTVAIDSVTGDITGYERRWNDPVYAFVIAPEPIVLKREATYTVFHKAQDMYPGLASGITILSADILWMDGHPAGTVPRPASIPLAWKIVFDDDLIRKTPNPVPAVAWVDVQSGSLISIDYQH
jgi:hypothetical protein